MEFYYYFYIVFVIRYAQYYTGFPQSTFCVLIASIQPGEIEFQRLVVYYEK